MVKILGKPDKEVMTKMLVAIALWTNRTLSSRCLKIIAMLLITTASSNGYAKNQITGMRVGVVQIEERAGLRVVVETLSLIHI
mgnify:CR=1 FL=1